MTGRLPALVSVGILLLMVGIPATPLEAQDGDGERRVLATLGELIVDGGVLMIPIGIASILTLGFALERIWALRRIKIVPPGIWQDVKSLLERGEIQRARECVAGEEFPVSRMIHAGLQHWEEGLQDVSTALVEAGQREADDLQRNLPALQGIASVSPLLGLLGTVTGMIQSFYTVARERSLGNPALLAEGIGEALVTTAAGLTVAIPAVILFYAFRGRTRRLARALDDIARGMLALHRERRLR